MRLPAPTRIAGFLLCLLLLPSAFALAQSTHTNKEIGYRLRTPSDFSDGKKNYSESNGVLQSNDPYHLETFRCTKPLRLRNGSTFYRQMTTYFFPERTAADIAKEKAKKEEGEKKDKDGNIELSLGFSKIYVSFGNYATDKIRGFYFSDEKAVKVSGFDATVYEMQFEKLTGTEKHYMACTYAIPGGEFAILFTCTQEHFKKTRSEFHSTFESFRLLSPDGLQAPRQRETRVTVEKPDENAAELSPEQLLKQRDEEYLKAIDSLESGWHHLLGEHFLVIYETDSAYAKKVLKHAEALRSWLGERLAPFGMDYVQDMIIRVSKSGGRSPGRRGGGITIRSSSSKHVRTLTMTRREKGRDSRDFTGLNVQFLRAWCEQRNEALWKRLPLWLRIGLEEVVEDARLKGSRLVFEIDSGEARNLRMLLDAQEEFKKERKGNPPIRPLKEVLDGSALENAGRSALMNLARQATSLTRYLIVGPGAKRSSTEVVVQHYIGHLHDLVKELEARLEQEKKKAEELEKVKGEMSEEQQLELEDEAYKKRREESAQKSALALVKQSFDLTFADWTEKDWQALDRAWLSFVKKRAE